MNAMESMSAWRAAFEAIENAPNMETRRAAFERFEAHGLPTRRDEYWKYTPVGALGPDAGVAARDGATPFAGVDGYRLTFVDGAFDEARSDWDALGAKIDLNSDGTDWFARVFSQLQTESHKKIQRPFADLNLAFFTEGVAARIPAGVTLDKPIHLRYEGAKPAHLRMILLVEEGAQVTVLESGAGALTTGAEVIIEKGAEFHHLRAQTEVAEKQFTHLFADIAEDAVFKSFTLSADGALLRNETVIALNGENGNGHIAAGVLGREKSHIDNTVYVSHNAAHCESRQVIKSVLDDDARGIFQGKIFVKEGAQKTDGYQISQSVLLNETAQFNAKPELEIYADDVICSHGSTTGALDETAMFYLRSRGVPKKAAEAMLVAAFVDDAILEISDEALQDEMRTLAAAWMDARGDAS